MRVLGSSSNIKYFSNIILLILVCCLAPCCNNIPKTITTNCIGHKTFRVDNTYIPEQINQGRPHLFFNTIIIAIINDHHLIFLNLKLICILVSSELVNSDHIYICQPGKKNFNLLRALNLLQLWLLYQHMIQHQDMHSPRRF